MICSPFFGDQFDNAQAAKDAGFAEILNLREARAEQLVSVIHTVLTDPRLVYKVRILYLQCISFLTSLLIFKKNLKFYFVRYRNLGKELRNVHLNGLTLKVGTQTEKLEVPFKA